MEADLWGHQSLLLSRTVFTAGGPLGIGGWEVMRIPGWVQEVMHGKAQLSPQNELWAALSIPGPLRPLAETSPYHTPYDRQMKKLKRE